MKKIFLALFVITTVMTTKAQSYSGFYHDNYAGVQSVLFNPASIADSRFKTDINLVSVRGSVGNDYYGVHQFDLFKRAYDIEKETKKFSPYNNNFIANVDVMGPSFMFNIAPRHSIAVFTRGRSVANISKIDGELVSKLHNSFNTLDNFTSGSQNSNIVANAWAELGLSYATVLLDSKKHFLKAGVSVKYLQGLANTYGQLNNATLKVNPLDRTITTTGTLMYGESQNFENNSKYKFDRGSNGLGLDFGFEYEYRPHFEKYKITDKNGKIVWLKNKNKYKYRFGVSLTDLGSISYKGTANTKKYDLNNTLTEAQFNAAKNPSDLFNNNYSVISRSTVVKAYLPTALHANLDWNIHNKFYLNVNGDYNVNNIATENKNTIANSVMVIPRYESESFGFYLPVGMVQYSGLQVGTGFRIGQFFLGSGSVLSNLILKDSKAMDVHMGLKIPISQR